MNITVCPGKAGGTVAIPASKSHTIRALLIASLARGKSMVRAPLESKDTRACIKACRILGADITERGSLIEVKGTGGIIPPLNGKVRAIDVANSGTTLYLAAGVAALSSGEVLFTGDEQIQRRPIEPLLQALRDLGAKAESVKGNGCAPVKIQGPLKGGSTSIECPTSQYLSSLLIAAPLAQGVTEINVPLLHEKPYAEMTLHWLKSQGIKLEREELRKFRIPGGQAYTAFEGSVPADFSSATFFFCLAAVTGGTLTLTGLDFSDPQGDKEVVSMLERMGCVVETSGSGVTITGGSLRGAELDLNSTPDALPALAVTACFAEGKTRLYNVPQARLKETDRIAVMAAELKKMGAKIEEFPDGLEIVGSPLKGCLVEGHADHRVVMALAVGAFGASGNTTITTAESAGVTFPGFFDLLEQCRI